MVTRTTPFARWWFDVRASHTAAMAESAARQARKPPLSRAEWRFYKVLIWIAGLIFYWSLARGGA